MDLVQPARAHLVRTDVPLRLPTVASARSLPGWRGGRGGGGNIGGTGADVGGEGSGKVLVVRDAEHLADAAAVRRQHLVAVGETVILLHPLSVSLGINRGCQQNDSLADG